MGRLVYRYRGHRRKAPRKQVVVRFRDEMFGQFFPFQKIFAVSLLVSVREHRQVLPSDPIAAKRKALPRKIDVPNGPAGNVFVKPFRNDPNGEPAKFGEHFRGIPVEKRKRNPGFVPKSRFARASDRPRVKRRDAGVFPRVRAGKYAGNGPVAKKISKSHFRTIRRCAGKRIKFERIFAGDAPKLVPQKTLERMGNPALLGLRRDDMDASHRRKRERERNEKRTFETVVVREQDFRAKMILHCPVKIENADRFVALFTTFIAV